MLDAKTADFAPGLLGIQDSPPARMPLALLYTVGVLALVLMAWAYYAKLDIVASAEGKLVPQNFVKIVQPSESGVVTQILVRDGDQVKAGQVLLRLDPKLSEADGTMLRQDVAMRKMSLRRIDAELKGQAFALRSGDAPELFEQINAQFKAHRQAYLDSIEQELEAQSKAKQDLLGAKQLLNKLVETLPLYQQSADAHVKLVDAGYISALANNDKQREFTEKRQDLKAQESNVAALGHLVSQSDKKLAQLKSSYESQLLAERLDIESQLNKISGELSKQNHRAKFLELRAPEAGFVKDLATHTVGAVVSPGTVMLNLVPLNDPLLAEVFLKNEDVGFTRTGQPVRLKLAAYPFQKYGLLEGRVQNISADASVPMDGQRSPNAASLNPATYRVLVTLDTQQLVSPSGYAMKLSPGMQLAAEVHQGRRSVLEYLISPVQKVRQEAGRER